MEDAWIHCVGIVEEVKLFNNQQLFNTATSQHRSIIHISNDFWHYSMLMLFQGLSLLNYFFFQLIYITVLFFFKNSLYH